MSPTLLVNDTKALDTAESITPNDWCAASTDTISLTKSKSFAASTEVMYEMISEKLSKSAPAPAKIPNTALEIAESITPNESISSSVALISATKALDTAESITPNESISSSVALISATKALDTAESITPNESTSSSVALISATKALLTAESITPNEVTSPLVAVISATKALETAESIIPKDSKPSES